MHMAGQPSPARNRVGATNLVIYLDVSLSDASFRLVFLLCMSIRYLVSLPGAFLLSFQQYNEANHFAG